MASWINRSRIVIGARLLLMLPAARFAQGTAPLPGVTVSTASPNLQRARTSVTNQNGERNFAALPPGNYSVTFSLEGMTTVNKRANVALLRTARVDVDLPSAEDLFLPRESAKDLLRNCRSCGRVSRDRNSSATPF